MPYAVLLDVEVKWRPLTSAFDQARATALLEEAGALLDAALPALASNLAAGTVSPILARKVVTDAVIRVLANPAGVSSQNLGPEAVTYTGVRTLGTVAFTADEIASLAPSTDPAIVGGMAIGTAKIRKPLALRLQLQPQWLGERGELGALEDMGPSLAAELVAEVNAEVAGAEPWIEPALLNQAFAPLDRDGNA